jgi:ATP-dependent Lon protease
MTELAVRELPLFPLPDVVLFPQEVLPLHIFEQKRRRDRIVENNDKSEDE